MRRKKEINDGLPITIIVRIYRFPGDAGKELAGVVEKAGSEAEKGFNGFDELWEILNEGGVMGRQGRT